MAKREKDNWMFNDYLRWWRGRLYRAYISAYVWSGESVNALPPYTIERMLYNNSCIGLVKVADIDNKYSFFARCSLFGVTDYDNVFTNMTFTTPMRGGEAEIPSALVFDHQVLPVVKYIGEPLFSNTSREPGKIIVSRYANLLAHNDLTLRSYMVNLRATGIIAADNQVTGEAINQWYDSLLMGKLTSVVDATQMASLINSQGLRLFANNYPSSTAIKELLGAQIQLLREFYAQIGIKVAPEKKEREIVAEVEADDVYLEYNTSSGLALRKDFCERARKHLDADIDVKVYASKQTGGNSNVGDNNNWGVQ